MWRVLLAAMQPIFIWSSGIGAASHLWRPKYGLEESPPAWMQEAYRLQHSCSVSWSPDRRSTPIQSWWGGLVHPVLMVGYPIRSWWGGTSIQSWWGWGGYPIQSRWGVPPSWTWDGDTPHPGPEMGVPPILDLRWEYPRRSVDWHKVKILPSPILRMWAVKIYRCCRVSLLCDVEDTSVHSGFESQSWCHQNFKPEPLIQRKLKQIQKSQLP